MSHLEYQHLWIQYVDAKTEWQGYASNNFRPAVNSLQQDGVQGPESLLPYVVLCVGFYRPRYHDHWTWILLLPPLCFHLQHCMYHPLHSMCAPRRDDIPYYFQTVDEIYFPFQRLHDLFPLCHDHYHVDVLLHDPRLRDDILVAFQTDDEIDSPVRHLDDPFPLLLRRDHDHQHARDPRHDDILSFSQTSDETYLPLLPLSDLQM
mmetsp:Transcript_11064/g.16618  ORF Transcript_11064/g.16618 Transcript_11064/m.16618 type:complete len:205 (-) Transcript_11064:1373-1987(-)